MTGLPPPLSPMAQRRIETLLRLYRDAQARINRQLASAATTNFKRFRLNEQLAQINRIVDALDEAGREAAVKLTPDTYQQGADIAREAMAERGMSTPAVSMGNAVNTASVQALADQMAADLVAANASIKRTARRILMQTQQVLVDEAQINSIIARGMVEGASRRDVSSALRAALEKNLEKGAKVEIIGKDGKKRAYDPGDYAELVARTRTREAVTEGSVRYGAQHGVTLFQVSVHDNPCESICAAKQGKIYSLVPDSGFPMLESRPPFHPRCLLPETPVFAPGQIAASAASYSGPVFDMLLSNSARASVTPNHMFLTPFGFVFAKDLREGDHIITSGLFEDVVFGDPYNNNRPSTVAEIFESFSVSAGVASSCVPVTSVDFHGDGRFINGNINIVRTNSLLYSDRKPSVNKAICDLDFSGSDIGWFGLSGCRNSAAMLKRLFLAFDRSVSGFRELCAAIYANARETQAHGIACISFLNAPLFQDAINNYLCGVERTNEIANTLASDVSIADFAGGKQFSGRRPERNAFLFESIKKGMVAYAKSLQNIFVSHPGEIRTASVVFNGVRDYSGHVYDLQTLSSLYICNGMISSNCKHVLLPYVIWDDGELARLRELSNSKRRVADLAEYAAIESGK